ncbi:Uncharacterised protein [Mycobacterium tuberculosis]|nr:Uncharacterised protein [Mycobacterium tuberculosis]
MKSGTTAANVAGQQGSAPRTRGWFPLMRLPEPFHPVGPAHAGMVRSIRARGSGPLGRPRARGDGSQRDCTGVRTFPSAPRTRGWFGDRLPVRGGRDVGPAHAGMVPRTGPRRGRSRCRPRARGDGSSPPAPSPDAAWSAPRTRGWFLDDLRVPVVGCVGPAHAGMVRCTATGSLLRRRPPRARGDGSVSDALAQAPARPARQPGRRHHPAGLVAGGQGWRPGGRHGRPVASAQTGPAAHLGRPSIWSWWRISANISRRCNTVNSPSSSPLRRGSR